jgi:hypothetical protein
VPIYAPAGVSGANGSSFATSTNEVSPTQCSYWPADHRLAANRISRLPHLPQYNLLDSDSPDRPQARIMFVDKACYDAVRVGLLVSSSGARAGGGLVAMPVVRERDFLQGETWLVTVPNFVDGEPGGFGPLTPIYRHKLRVFSVDDSDQGRVTVRLWVSNTPGLGGSPDYEYQVVMNLRDGNDPSFPFYGEVNLDNVCKHIASYACMPTIGTVEIVPASLNLRYWAYVSSTNNATQQVLITLPQ